APGANPSSIAVTPEGADISTSTNTVAVSGDSGTVTIPGDDLVPGGFQISLLDNAGHQIAGNRFWVRSKQNTVELRTDQSRYAVGEPIIVSWDNGPANRWDWIAAYHAGAANQH